MASQPRTDKLANQPLDFYNWNDKSAEREGPIKGISPVATLLNCRLSEFLIQKLRFRNFTIANAHRL